MSDQAPCGGSPPPRVDTPCPEPVEPWRNNLRGEAAARSLLGPRPASWYTGVAPGPACPGFEAGKLHSLPLPNLATCTRDDAQRYFDNTWTLTEVLFSGLQGEEPFYCPPYHKLRHPLIFYYAHPAVLYVNKLRVAGLLDAGVDAHMESIMETARGERRLEPLGVDEMSWDDLSKNDAAWPSVASVTAYRRRVYALVSAVIARHPALSTASRLASSPAWAVFMGFEHERIHLETSSVLVRELPLRLLRRPEAWPEAHPSALLACGGGGGGGEAAAEQPVEGVHYPANELLAVPPGRVVLGKPADWPSFGWDNEYGRRAFDLPSFKASRYAVSNGQFLEFIKAGGYSSPRLWSPDGWRWRAFRNARWPSFWQPTGPAGLHSYSLRLTFEAVPMPWALPAVVNVHEARAFCAWATERRAPDAARGPGATPPLRLLTEAEHARLRALDGGEEGEEEGAGGGCDGRPPSDVAMTTSGLEARGAVNLGLAWGSENAVDAMPAGRSGFSGVAGSVWQWCEDTAAALPGFAVHPYYEDFSTPCFDGRHHIIAGASWVSTGDLASRFARYHFRPHFHQHAGFRLVCSDSAARTTSQGAPPPYAGGWVPPAGPEEGEGGDGPGGCAAAAEAMAVSRALLRGGGGGGGGGGGEGEAAGGCAGAGAAAAAAEARHGARVAAALLAGARALLGAALTPRQLLEAAAGRAGGEAAAGALALLPR